MLSEEQQKLVEDNMNLVFYYLHKKNIPMDLCDVGFISLCKAAKAYNKDSKFKFATFALKVIKNDYAMLIRNQEKVKFEQTQVSLHQVIYSSSDEDIYLIDTISSESKIDKDLILDELITNLRDYMGTLPLRDQIIISDYLADITQRETANKLNVSQAQVSRLRKKLFAKFKSEYYSDIHINEMKELI